MVRWEIWLIILIPVAVSILSLLFRSAKEEPRRNGRPRPNPQDVPSGRPPRRSVSDIDQFLEEINRRRREAAEKRKSGEPVVVAVPAPPPVRPRPAPPVLRPARRVERERQPPRIREPLPPPERIIITEAVPLPPSPAAPEWQPPPPAEPRHPPQGAKPTVVNPALAQVLPLLRSPQGLRSAIVLREIFDRPLCQRGRQGPLISHNR
jgi:hypothetical protein